MTRVEEGLDKLYPGGPFAPLGMPQMSGWMCCHGVHLGLLHPRPILSGILWSSPLWFSLGVWILFSELGGLNFISHTPSLAPGGGGAQPALILGQPGPSQTWGSAGPGLAQPQFGGGLPTRYQKCWCLFLGGCQGAKENFLASPEPPPSEGSS